MTIQKTENRKRNTENRMPNAKGRYQHSVGHVPASDISGGGSLNRWIGGSWDRRSYQGGRKVPTSIILKHTICIDMEESTNRSEANIFSARHSGCESNKCINKLAWTSSAALISFWPSLQSNVSLFLAAWLRSRRPESRRTGVSEKCRRGPGESIMSANTGTDRWFFPGACP